MHFNEKPHIVAVNWEGFQAQGEGIAFAANPYAADPFKRALWSKGWSDSSNGRPAPETAFEGFWIVDDVLDGQAKEGFQVFYGCPFRAIGTKQGEFALLGLALASVPEIEAVYRVKLARRHGEHSVALIRTSGGSNGNVRKTGRADLNPEKAFDQTIISWEGDRVAEIMEQKQIDNSEAQGIHEVHVGPVNKRSSCRYRHPFAAGRQTELNHFDKS
ncbi:hypothetical protein [Massilia sp. LjRoot122]|uniref:hypothetical protein n=1 Tax=Massilia sp. LjRoot122 TaxID=3342257 RepID=UPI003ECD8DE9